MHKPQRNEPCPCGSGLKYKKCCWERQASPAAVHPVHDVDRQLVKRLSKLLDSQEKRWGTHLVEDYGEGYEVDFEEENSWFFPYAFYHYRGPDDASATLLEQLLERKEMLSGPELELARAHQAAHVSMWQMVEVRDGREVLLRDLLLGDERWVHDVGLVESFRPGLTLLGRVLEVGGSFVLIGMFHRPLPPLSAEGIRSEFVELHRPHRKITRKLLREPDWVSELTVYWREEVANLDERPVPRMQNSEGQDLLLVRDRYVFDPSSREQVGLRLRELDQPEDRGFIRGEGGVIVGQFTLQERALIVETNSLERAEELSERLRGWKIPGWKRARRDKRTPEQLMEKRSAAAPPRLDPDQLAALMAFKQDWMRRWLDEGVPALDGVTPREAARTPRLRERLRALLSDFEMREANLPAEQRNDIGWLRRELGLGGSPAPLTR